MLPFVWKERRKREREEIYTCILANAWIIIGRISKKLSTVFAFRQGNRVIEKKERDVNFYCIFFCIFVAYVCKSFFTYIYVHTCI